jgi:hypothetical protein
MFIAALFTIAKLWKQQALQLMNGLRKCGIYTIEFYSAIRKNETMWIQLEDIMLSEVSQAQKDKGCMFSLIYGR